MRSFGLDGVQRERVWELRGEGMSLASVAARLGVRPEGVVKYVASRGGVRPVARRRPARCLSGVEREEISRGLARGESCHQIAAGLGRSPSTVSREVAANGGRGGYRAQAAEARAWERARRPQAAKLAVNARLRAVVAAKLRRRWSPEQIAGWLRREYRDDPDMQVSHETIYLSLFVQSRGALRRELCAHLRSRRQARRPRAHRQSGHGRGQIPDRVMISQRPPEIEDRAVPGAWEGDLVLGRRPTAIATLVERTSRYVQLVALPDGVAAASVRRALAAGIATLPAQLVGSLTWDQGKEMSQHVQFTVDTGVRVYFCDPNSPWQRGSNENTNGLLRQYFPKGHNFAQVTQDQLDAVAAELNGRPRKTLGFMTPGERFAELVAEAGATPAG